MSDKRTGNRYGWFAFKGGAMQHLWYKREDMDMCLSLCGELRSVEDLVADPNAPHCGHCRMLASFGPSYGLLAEVS